MTNRPSLSAPPLEQARGEGAQVPLATQDFIRLPGPAVLSSAAAGAADASVTCGMLVSWGGLAGRASANAGGFVAGACSCAIWTGAALVGGGDIVPASAGASGCAAPVSITRFATM